MFTGIVSAIGIVTADESAEDGRYWIACPYDPDGIAIGASIACAGVCLTVVGLERTAQGCNFAVDVSPETIARTAGHYWRAGGPINLERALALGEELGGHLVTGHVDTVGEIARLQNDGNSTRITIVADAAIAPFLAEKGSITVDGVSLTVNAVDDLADGRVAFGVSIIPHTGEVTTLGALREGSAVNLEVDLIARYLSRMQALRG